MAEKSLDRLISLDYLKASPLYDIIDSIVQSDHIKRKRSFQASKSEDISIIKKIKRELSERNKHLLGLDKSSNLVLYKELKIIHNELRSSQIRNAKEMKINVLEKGRSENVTSNLGLIKKLRFNVSIDLEKEEEEEKFKMGIDSGKMFKEKIEVNYNCL